MARGQTRGPLNPARNTLHPKPPRSRISVDFIGFAHNAAAISAPLIKHILSFLLELAYISQSFLRTNREIAVIDRRRSSKLARPTLRQAAH